MSQLHMLLRTKELELPHNQRVPGSPKLAGPTPKAQPQEHLPLPAAVKPPVVS
jgi:hypothetical protein